MQQIKRNRVLSFLLVIVLLFVFSLSILSKPTAISFIKEHGAKEEQTTSSYSKIKVNKYCDSYQLYAPGESNVEHIFAQSWMKGSNIVNDYYNIRKANNELNSKRGNKGFSEVEHNQTTEIYVNGVLYGWIDDLNFEPLDEYKGDIARTLLYMYYNYDLSEKDIKNHFEKKEMIKWAKIDPLSQEEKDFAKRVYKYEKYLNLFLKRQTLILYF